MKQLKLKLWRINNVVVMQVLQQDDRMRGLGTLWEDKETGLNIRSTNKPRLCDNDIYIGGSWGDKDELCAGTTFYDEDNAQKFIDRIIKTVKNCNESFRDGEDEEDISTVVEAYIAE